MVSFFGFFNADVLNYFPVVRPPYGNSDDRVTNILNRLGYTVVNWSVDSKDYETHSLSAEMHNYHRELGSSNGPKGGIGLQHDVSWSVDKHALRNLKLIHVLFFTPNRCTSRQRKNLLTQ